MTQTIEGLEVEAFCQMCPDPEQVTQRLHELGFALTFQMDAVIYRPWDQTPNLPAQLHYRDDHSTEIIYLAGPDASMDDIRLPVHASRFWLYCGKHAERYLFVRQTLASWWNLNWRGIAPDGSTARGIA